MRQSLQLLASFAVLAMAGCSEPGPGAEGRGKDQPGDAALPPPTYELALPEDLRSALARPYTGDLDGMVQRRLIRAGVPFNRTFYFIDKGVQRGLSYEYLMLFEEQLNKDLNSGNTKVHVVLLPMPRDALLPSLQAGKVDLVVAQLTVTPERLKSVDFTEPTRTGVDEVLVTGPAARGVASLEQLAGQKVFVRRSSSYYASIDAYNRRQAERGERLLAVTEAPESLEDDDILEMVNAGLVPATVVDNYIADYWKQVFPNLSVHHDVKMRSNARAAVAIRKESPKLAAELNRFISRNGLDSVTGRILSKRYLQSTEFVQNADSEEERRKFLTMVDLFRRYGRQYDFDYLLMAAQGYQESRLDQQASSPVGAIGVMQLMPATGREQNVGDVRQLEPNIHAGVKYMRTIRDRYFESEPMSDLNKGLFTFAAYNAGPGRIRQLRREAEQRGLNPQVWFGNVETIASERIGRETVTYVSNIYKYYIAYRLITEEDKRRTSAKATLEQKAR